MVFVLVRFKAQGNKAFTAGKFDEAVALYSKAIAMCPDQASFLGNRSAAYFMQKQYNDSLRDCQYALEIDPNMLKCLQRAARCFLFRGEFDLALGMLGRALAVDANDKESQENKALATALKDDIAKADALLAAGRARQAQLAYDKLELSCPLASYISIRSARAYIGQHHSSRSFVSSTTGNSFSFLVRSVSAQRKRTSAWRCAAACRS
jgi:tetratricopeptide (TPR) repeat protein